MLYVVCSGGSGRYRELGGVFFHGADEALVFGDPVVELGDAVLDVGHGGVGFAAAVAAVGAWIDEEINCFADGGQVPDRAGGADEKFGFFVGMGVAETGEKALDAIGERSGAGERGREV